jgi:signal transduction histidine kinase/CheY-like chemotaxis protein
MVNKLSESNERLNTIVNVSEKKINLSREILVEVLQAARFEKNMILVKDPVRRERYKGQLDAALKNIDKKIPELESLVDEKGQLLLNDFKKTWNEYKPSIDEIVRLVSNNETEKAFEISSVDGYKTRDLATEQLEKIIEKNEADVAADVLQNKQDYSAAITLIIVLVCLSLVVAVFVSYWIVNTITGRISFISKEAEKIASREFADTRMEDNGNDELRTVFNALVSINESFREVTTNANSVASGNYAVSLTPRSGNDTLGIALNTMTASLRETTAANEKHNWLTAGQNQLNEKLRGDQETEEVATSAITFLASYLGANIGALYLFNENENAFVLSGQYAFSAGANGQQKFMHGEGLIGQVAREQKQLVLENIREEHIRIVSSALNAKPEFLLITPFLFEGKTLGVIEIGSLSAFTETGKEFIRSSMEAIAISVNSAIARKRIQELLEETQVQSEELQTQQEELKQVNEELEEQAQNLKQQQEELQMTNEELEEQTQALEVKNREVEASRYDIEQKTKQLEVSSKYKSEFLANMSHELRTPLNSLLILSRDLSENKKKNLSADQVQSAEIIYKSGNDLLVLINEVLDLSKIEAGKMDINIERVSLQYLKEELLRDFAHQAEKKGLELSITMDENLPDYIRTDSQRLNQVLRNLLSNAIKFTEEGAVTCSMTKHGEDKIRIAVTDTGIGISEDKQMAIFEAFQQADGGTSRKYGGTGLGLSISRELAKLLSGEIKLSSKLNEGSTFSLIIPLELQKESSQNNIRHLHETHSSSKPVARSNDFLNYPGIEDDRENIQPDDKIVLVIEDDLKFAAIMLKQARDKNFKVLAATTGEDGLLLAEKFKPNAIILDLQLPGMSGHLVLSELKANPLVRHIPVHIMSSHERSIDPIKKGAIEYLTKPVGRKQMEEAFSRIENFVSRKMKNLLIIEDDENSRIAMRKLIGNGDVKCFEAGTGKEAQAIYKENQIDCIVLDIGLPDITGFELIYTFEKIKDQPIPPIIVYTGKELTKEENNELQKYAESIIIKGVKSEERLLDETALFLHRTISNLPEAKRNIINTLYDREAVFHSKKIVLVDDDMRNVFALSKILKERGMHVIKAENGIDALKALEEHPDADLVLMDIMMPEMDGYEAMKQIRLQRKFKDLPVIALTAKAMKDDRQKCIDAGANDYITKPVDVERLLSLMRVWLSK